MTDQYEYISQAKPCQLQEQAAPSRVSEPVARLNVSRLIRLFVYFTT